VAIAALSSSEVVKKLWEEHRIFLNVVDHPVVQGVRATPGLPTSVDEIDRFASALGKISATTR
jgi:selenocysteine lyase/cysteine desulfurase